MSYPFAGPAMASARAAALASLWLAPRLAHGGHHLVVLTGDGSGAYHPVDRGLAVLARALPAELRPENGAARASATNLALLETGAGDLGFSLVESWLGYRARQPAGQPSRLRGIAMLSPCPVRLLVPPEAAAAGWRPGLRLGLLRAGLAAPPLAGTIAALVAGLEAQLVPGLVERAALARLHAGTLDAVLAIATPGLQPPVPPVEARLVPLALPRLLIDRAGPAFMPVPLAGPPGSATGLTAGLASMLVTHADLPDTLALAVMRTLFEHLPTRLAWHAAGHHADRDLAPCGMPLLLHPAAAAYYAARPARQPPGAAMAAPTPPCG